MDRDAIGAVSESLGAIAISEIDRDIARHPDLARIAFKSLNAEPSEFEALEWFRFTTFARPVVGPYEGQWMK